jgi:hypothetical protein
MTSELPRRPEDPVPRYRPPTFSFSQGGLFPRLLRWRHSGGDARLPLRARVVAVTLLAWLPLLLLSALEGHALGARVAGPFLHDIDAHIRFLLSLPLLMVAAVEFPRGASSVSTRNASGLPSRFLATSGNRPLVWTGPSA